MTVSTGWIGVKANGAYHVVPEDDTLAHEWDLDCACLPEITFEGEVTEVELDDLEVMPDGDILYHETITGTGCMVTHSAWDGRE